MSKDKKCLYCGDPIYSYQESVKVADSIFHAGCFKISQQEKERNKKDKT